MKRLIESLSILSLITSALGELELEIFKLCLNECSAMKTCTNTINTNQMPIQIYFYQKIMSLVYVIVKMKINI